MKDLITSNGYIDGEIDGDGEIFAECGYIDKAEAIQIIDHLTKVFDIKQEQA